MTNLRIVFAAFLLCGVGFSALAQNFSGGFPFALPFDDTSESGYLPQFPAHPITEADRVVAAGPHFVAGGQPIRFWGVNITSAGCFPTHGQADKVAGRLRKMGVNLVRFHHVDNPAWSGHLSTIFEDSQQGTRTFDAQTLDRLDYFIHRLKQEGIYVNMNLNVTRTFRPGDGVPLADSLVEFGKGVTLFDPQLQALQREYAEMLLGHTNPHTGMPLATDPVLAMVEMNNENTLYGFWKSDALQPFAQGGSLTHYHNDLLDTLWTDFLTARYGNTAALSQSWATDATNNPPTELMTNGGFETSTLPPSWDLELHEQAQATISPSQNTPQSGAFCALLNVAATSSEGWHLQFKQAGRTFERDTLYRLSFWARADAERAFSVSVMRDDVPYTWYGGQQFTLSTEWQQFSLFVRPTESIITGRISISPLGGAGQYYFDNFQMGQLPVVGLAAGETLESGQVARIPWTQRVGYSDARVLDMSRFYVAVQRDHFVQMKQFLNNEVGVLAPITGTNALVGPADVAHQLDLDYIDDHSYWDHPWFPNTPWDSRDWQIGNQPQLRNPNLGAISTGFSGLARADQPFTLSEYNQPAPNRYRTEMPNTLLAYAAFQGVDGLMFFDYTDRPIGGQDVVDGFFALHNDHSIMAQFPGAAMAYRRGYLQEAPQPLLAHYTPDDVHRLHLDDTDGRWGRFTPYSKRLALTQGVQTASYEAPEGDDFATWPTPEGPILTTSTGETRLDTERGLLMTRARRFEAITGFLSEAVGQQWGRIEVLEADGFGALQWIEVDGEDFYVGNSLMTLTSAQQNTGTVWDGTLTVRDQWGVAPTVQRPLRVVLKISTDAEALYLRPLDARGIPTNGFYVQRDFDGDMILELDQNLFPTLWFSITAFPILPHTTDLYSTLPAEVYPNPVGPGQPCYVALPDDTTATDFDVRLTDAMGRTVPVRIRTEANRFVLDMADLTQGLYAVRMTDAATRRHYVARVVKGG